ncbi:MAG TPA: class I SAM-dependent methyltransferase [Longimicrobium sp.]
MFSESAELYDRIYAWKDYPAEAARVRGLVTAAGGRGGGTLLDVACGTGMHLQALREHYTVEGVDLEPGLLEAARRRLPDVPLHLGDMRDFELGRRFDVVTCLFSAIGYTRTAAGLNAALRSMAGHLAPGGVLLVEPWFTAEMIQPGRVSAETVEEPGLTIVRMAHMAVEGTISLLTFEYLVGHPDGITRASELHEMGLFSREQMTAAFETAGLRVSHDEEGVSGRGAYIGVREG